MPAVVPAVASDHLHLEQQLVHCLVNQVAICRRQLISTDTVEAFQDNMVHQPEFLADLLLLGMSAVSSADIS